MYAIIETGGKQLRVEEGKKIFVEKLSAEVGSEVTFTSVVLASNTSLSVGAPYLENVSVLAEVMEHGRGEKIVIFKKKRRQGYRRKQGHRQSFTALKIKSIVYN